MCSCSGNVEVCYRAYLFDFFFQAEDGIRDLVRSRGLGDVYKRQAVIIPEIDLNVTGETRKKQVFSRDSSLLPRYMYTCLLYTSDAADDLLCVDLGGRRIIKKKKTIKLFAYSCNTPTAHCTYTVPFMTPHYLTYCLLSR